jgi:hypothetical protein
MKNCGGDVDLCSLVGSAGHELNGGVPINSNNKFL